MSFHKPLILIGFCAGLAACATTADPIPEPVLEFQVADNCSDDIDLAQSIGMPDDAKLVKRMMRNRTIVLKETMSESTSCLTGEMGFSGPYAIFEVPDMVTGQVITAGSIIDSNSMFAAKIDVLDSEGRIVRSFSRDEYRRLGERYGVQFQPKSDQAFVLIRADKDIIGDLEKTIETAVSAQTVTMSTGVYTSSGTNFVGVQEDFSRAYSYDGDVGIRVVFPKQEKPE